jgi:hypothetical protein
VSENEAEIRVQMGNFFLKNGLPASAQENYRRAVAVAEPIAASHTDEQEVRYPLAGAYYGLGRLAAVEAERATQSPQKQEAGWTEAKSWFQKSVDTWRQVRQPAAISPNGFACGSPAEAARELAHGETALAQLRTR